MSNFLETALDLARRGFKVLPLISRDKWPLVPGGYKAGTTDPDQLELWWRKTPTANVGIAAGRSDLVVMDADHGLTCLEEFLSWRDRNGLPPTYTVHSGRRPEYGAQMYYHRKGGITTQGRKTFKLDGVTGDFKSEGGLVVHPPSIHPESGEAYELLLDLPIAECPEFILSLPTAEGKERSNGQPNAEGLIEGNRNEDMCSFIGQIRSRIFKLSESTCLDICRLRNEQYAKGPMDDVEVEDIVRKQYRLYPDLGPAPVATIGGKTAYTEALAKQDAEVVEELDASLKATPLPDYPLAPFEDTVYLDFAKRASRGNYVPLSFFIEGAMTYAGAICGNNLRGFADEITPRLFTVLLGLAGAGKGTTFRRIRNSMPSGRLHRVVTEDTNPRPCSALVANPASENGLNDALLQHASVILAFEEMDKLMEKTRIQGSGGSLMSIIRGLFDDIVPEITTCKGRDVVATVAYLSLLGAMTPNLWRRALEGQDSYGTGLGGRFNLVATNEDRLAPSLMPMDLGDLHETLERKFFDLDAAPQLSLCPDKAAFKVLDEWWGDNFKGQQHYNRVNIITHRKALHLAWIRELPVITAEIMRQAIQLAEYLVAVRDAFAVTKGEDKTAIGENRVLHILKRIQPKAVRPSQVVELLDGVMSRASIYRAFESLVASDEAEKIIKKDDSCKRPYAVFRLNLKLAR